MGQLYAGFSIFTEFASQDSFKSLLAKMSPVIGEELNRCFQLTFNTKQIKQYSWPEDTEIQTFKTSSCDIVAEQLKTNLTSEEDQQEVAIEAMLADMSWFHRNKANFIAFSNILQG